MRLLYGVGVNDSTYPVTRGTKYKVEWRCPYYLIWTNMLKRCYSPKYQEEKPTYVGCSVIKEWYYFMTFRKWVMTQDWEGKQLDKDLLVFGNRIYSPDTCVFVSREVNMLISGESDREDLPCGVYLSQVGTYYAKAGFRGSSYIGSYKTIRDTREAYLKRKVEISFILASEENNAKVKHALINRFIFRV